MGVSQFSQQYFSLITIASSPNPVVVFLNHAVLIIHCNKLVKCTFQLETALEGRYATEKEAVLLLKPLILDYQLDALNTKPSSWEDFVEVKTDIGILCY